MRKAQSKITRRRIAEVETQIKTHHKNIAMLLAFTSNHLTLKYRKYKRTPEDDARMHWSIKNLNEQITLLEVELKTLLHYGA